MCQFEKQSPIKTSLLILEIILLLGVCFTESNNFKGQGQSNKKPFQTSSESRNFTSWQNCVNIAKSLEYIDYVSQQSVNQWLKNITNASQKYSTFCNTGDDLADKQEFAAFFTIIRSETEFSYGFPCSRELRCPDCVHCSYNSKGLQCLQNQNLQYYGRGPIQLSWDYNYKAFSQSYFGDERFLNNPTLMENNPEISWVSAIWFWMNQQGYGGWCMPQAGWSEHYNCNAKCPNGPQGCTLTQCTHDHWLDQKVGSCLDAMHSSGSIGEVINIVNGGYDCFPTTTYFINFGHTLKRVEWWGTILQNWGLGLPWTNLKPVPINKCPRAVNHIYCTQLKINQWCWGCCSEI
ncbi:hypothetical protein ABPG72_004876 [Tetrahymena utriculariae]